MERNIGAAGRLLAFSDSYSSQFASLIPIEFYGTESLSKPFHFKLDCLCKDVSLTGQDWLNRPVGIRLQDALPRYFHGYISAVEMTPIRHDGLRNVRLLLKPQFSYLDFVANCQIFQNQSVVEIIKECLSYYGIVQVDYSGIRKTYPQKPYCVQYNETSFNFISRLLEEAGIFYYFQHDENHHTLLLSDEIHTFSSLEKPITVQQWESIHTLGSTRFEYRGYDETHSTRMVSAQCDTPPPERYVRDFERYHWEILSGEPQKNASLMHGRAQWQKEIYKGKSQDKGIQAGICMYLNEEKGGQREGNYYVIDVTHHARDQTHLAQGDKATEVAQSYQNELRAVSRYNPFVPERRHKKPKISGYQSAIVAGGSEEAGLHTDKYGRIKVQFLWDRRDLFSEQSSIWLRVSQTQSGLFDSHFLPRIGQEVVVGFLNGDIDYPICLGTHYNGSHQAPYPLPEHAHCSGIKTRSVASMNPEEGHELRFDDEAGRENLAIHAQRCLFVDVSGHEKITIGGNYQSEIKGQQQIKVKGSSQIESPKAVILRAGTSEIQIEPHQIRIKGSQIRMGNIGKLPGEVIANKKAQRPVWLESFIWNAHHPKRLPKASYDYTFKDAKMIGLSSQTDDSGVGPIMTTPKAKWQHLTLNQTELIKVGQQIISYPVDTVDLNTAEFERSDQCKTVYGYRMQKGDSLLKTYALHPPILINLREDASNQARYTLTDDELEYLKANGNNALLFIHGFNVPLGQYAKQILAMEFDNGLKIQYSQSNRTLYRDSELLRQRFPVLNHVSKHIQEKQLGDNRLNGSDAHNWYVHMEDNLNRATGKFHRDNYLNYTRLVNIAWSGDSYTHQFSNEINYIDNEGKADRAGHRLVELIRQLHREKITINVIAHSLGNRVLLTALNDLGRAGAEEIIDTVILWEAALQDTALSDNADLDNSNKHNSHFIDAHKAAQRFLVLYSHHDEILSYAFWFATKAGASPYELFHGRDWGYFLHPYVPYTVEEKAIIQNYYQASLPYQEIMKIPIVKQEHNDYIQRYLMLSEHMEKMYQKYRYYYKTRPALGYTGPYLEDNFIKENLNTKIIPVNQSKWLFSHSGMKIPSPALMKHVYIDVIMNKVRGIKKFGRY